MKQVSGKLRMELAQYRELNTFAQFGSDLDDSTRKVLDSGVRMMQALRQRRYEPIPDWKQALLIYAVSEGYADGTEPKMIEEFEKKLYSYFENKYPDMVKTLVSGAKMNKSFENRLKAVLKSFAEVG